MHERYRTVDRDRHLAIENSWQELGMAVEYTMREHMQIQNWSDNHDRTTALESDLKRLRQESRSLPRGADDDPGNRDPGKRG